MKIEDLPSRCEMEAEVLYEIERKKCDFCKREKHDVTNIYKYLGKFCQNCFESNKPITYSINDRVAVYSHRGRFTGKITGMNDDFPHLLFVTEDGFYSCHNDSPFHVKQCRKLRKKK